MKMETAHLVFCALYCFLLFSYKSNDESYEIIIYYWKLFHGIIDIVDLLRICMKTFAKINGFVKQLFCMNFLALHFSDPILQNGENRCLETID